MFDRILLVEDDRDIAELIQINLADAGFDVHHADDGIKGLALAKDGGFNLIILDLMLPGLDGLEVCKRFRQDDPFTPIIMLTAKSEELDRVLGLELGADDYLTKPFSVRELLARVKAIRRRVEADLSRHSSSGVDERVQFGNLEIQFEKRKVLIDGQPVELTAKEYDLLELFARNPGRAYSRRVLLDTVWGYQYEGYDHTVNSHINRLRSKIEKDPSEPRFILTVWGVGYRFVELEEMTA